MKGGRTIKFLRYPQLIIGIWLFFFVLSIFYAIKLPTVLKGPGLTSDKSFTQVQSVLAADFHIPKEPVILLFEKKDQVSSTQFISFIREALINIQGMDGLSEVISPLASKDMIKGNFAYAILSFQQEPYLMGPVIEQIRNTVPTHPAMLVRVTGKSVVQEDVNQASQADLTKSELIGIPIALGVLLFAFGGLAAALIPLVVGWICVIGAMGVMYAVGVSHDLSIFVLNVIPMVGLALSIDFALIMVSRFRAELRGNSIGHALCITMSTAGRSIIFSALCVFFGLAATWMIPMPIFRSIAIGAIAVLLLSVAANLTLVPCLLLILGNRIGMGSNHHTRKTVGWYSISYFVMKRPIRMTILCTAILVICVLPLNKMQIVIPDATTLPLSYESRIADELYKHHFGVHGTSQVYVLAPVKEPSKVKEFMHKLDQDPLVLEHRSSPLIRNGRVLINVMLKAEASSKEAMEWVRNGEKENQSDDFWFGGEPKYQQEVFDEVFYHLKDILLSVVITNFIVLFVAFRSILIPIKTIILNLISLAVSFGILTWIFTEGIFGMEPQGIAIMIPIFIFGLVFGISMDYGVFLVSRMYEIYMQTQDNDRAVLEGISSTSRIITSAAAIMIAVTGSFASAGVVPMKQLGIGIASAILIDATIVRLILVPSLMKLLGSWNWWAPFRGTNVK